MTEQYTPQTPEQSDEQLAADIKARAAREAAWTVNPDGTVEDLQFEASPKEDDDAELIAEIKERAEIVKQYEVNPDGTVENLGYATVGSIDKPGNTTRRDIRNTQE